MNKELINTLFSEKNRLSKYIQAFYEKFIYFKDTTKPQVLLVSSGNIQKTVIDKYIDKSNEDYDIKSYTSDDLVENLDEVIFCDCIIIHTTALKITPESLFQVCNFAAKFHKKTYILLGGWDQIGCNSEKVTAKLDETQDVLNFMDFVDIFAVRKIPNCDEVINFEEATTRIISNIKAKFDFARNEQETNIFNYAKKLVAEELDDLDNKLFKEIQLAYDFKNTMLSKENGYKIELKNASVALTNIANDVYNFFKDKLPHSYINYFTYEEFNSTNFDELAEIIKSKINEEVKEFFDNYKKEPKNILNSQLENLKSNCVKQLNELTLPLSKINELPQEYFDEIKTKINNTTVFDEYLENLIQIYGTEMDAIQKTIVDNINMITTNYDQIENIDKINEKVQKMKLKMVSLAMGEASGENVDVKQIVGNEICNDLITDETNTENNSQSSNSPNKKMKPQDFCDLFITEAGFIGTRYSNDLITSANSKIKDSSSNYVHKYFAEILYSTDEIINQLTKIQESARNSL